MNEYTTVTRNSNSNTYSSLEHTVAWKGDVSVKESRKRQYGEGISWLFLVFLFMSIPIANGFGVWCDVHIMQDGRERDSQNLWERESMSKRTLEVKRRKKEKKIRGARFGCVLYQSSMR
jgi:hypothetical protein